MKITTQSCSTKSGNYQKPSCESIDIFCEGILCESDSEITDVEFEFDPTVKE